MTAVFESVWRHAIDLVPWVVAFSWGYSAVAKAMHPAQAVLALQSLGLGGGLARVTIQATASSELLLCYCLIRKDLRPAGILLSCALLAVFTCYLGYLVTRGDEVGCGCGLLSHIFESEKLNNLSGMCRNVGLLYALRVYKFYSESAYEG